MHGSSQRDPDGENDRDQKHADPDRERQRVRGSHAPKQAPDR